MGENKLNPELEVDDIIRVIDVEDRSIGGDESIPERFGVYRVIEIADSHYTNELHVDYRRYYYLEPAEPLKPGYNIHSSPKRLYQGDTWIYAEPPQAITEHKESKLNPELMMGDEIMVVSTEGIHDFGIPKLYKPYVVVGIKHRQRENWQGPETDTTYYQIEPMGMTDEERTGAMLAGGGRAKPLYIFTKDSSQQHSGNYRKEADQWILRPGFLRGELNEHNGYNEQKGRDEVQHIVDSVYPHIVNNLGPSEYVDEIPTLELHKDIYERLSGIEGMRGEESTSTKAQYDEYTNTIYVYYPNMENEKDIIQSLLHEYTHSLQNPEDSEENRKGGYDNDPDEQESLRAEDNWEDYLKYLQENINEHKESKVNPELKVDDIVRVIDVDGEHTRMPKRFGIYKVVKVGNADWRKQIYYDVIPYPDVESRAIRHYKELGAHHEDSDFTLHRGDTWVKMDNTIKEQEQPGLSPVLTYGDTILVVDVDREKESGNTSYTTPREGMRPVKYTPYTVVDKESNGSQSKWSWRYTLVPEDKLDEYEESLDSEYGDYETYEKLLYPWIYEWIYADTKTASKVDKLTITEQGVDTSWANDDDKVTLQDILELTNDIPTISYPTKELAKLPSLKKIVLGWNPEEIERISQVDVSRQYPILVMVNEYNEVQWILDGNHRAQQAVMNDIPTIPAKLIKPSDLDERSIKMFYPEGIPGGELGEEGETNEASRTLSKARKAGVDTYYPKSAVKSNPQRFRKYTRDKYLKEVGETLTEHKEIALNPKLEVGDVIRVIDSVGNDYSKQKPEKYGIYKVEQILKIGTKRIVYDIVPLDVNCEGLFRCDYLSKIKRLYQEDTWIKMDKVIKEQDEPIDTQGGEIVRGDTDNDYNDYSDEELEKRRTYDDFSDEEKSEIDAEYVDMTPFKPMERKILKTLHKHLERSDLQKLSSETPGSYGGLDNKFWDIMKFFGMTPGTEEENTRVSKYAKWASDNWTKQGDYNMEDPIKVPLKWYDVDREESGSQVEYKRGEAEVLGFDEDDASDRADSDFYAWGGEMETTDYGDYESYDSSISSANYIRMDEAWSPFSIGKPMNVNVSDKEYKAEQDLLFNLWRKIGPTLDPNKLKLVGFNMDIHDELSFVWDTLQEYYGDEELNNIIQERLEGLHDSWSYEYIVTSFEPIEEGDSEIIVSILVNGDTQIPINQESGGGAIDMSLWDINEVSNANDYQFDDVYDEVRSVISDDISNVLLKDLPVDMSLDYMDMSEPGTFENYVKENEVQVITEEDDGYIDDMVYIDEPRDKHIRKMGKGLGSLVGFPLDKYKNMPPPENESDTTEEEIDYLEGIPVDKNLVDSADEIRKHFSKFLTSKGLDYPRQEMKKVIRGVKAIILQLKYHYNRPRPWQIAQAKGLELNSETLQSSSSPSYPSGHATQGRFVSLYLSDLYPEYRNELMQIGDDIAFSRNMAKVHYPSDSEFGKLLGDDMYKFINTQNLNEQVMVDKGDMLKSDIFKILSNKFTLNPTDYSEIKDNEGNYYGVYDIKLEEYVNMSDLIQGVLDFIVYGVESGDFKEEDIQKGVSAITDWVSLMMNQEKEPIN